MRRTFIRFGYLLLITAFTIAAVIYILINTIVVGSSAESIYNFDDIDKLDKTQCVLVLGSRVFSDESLSNVLQDRVDYAIAIYKAGKADRLLLSGDHGQKDYDEVNAMMNYAIEQGVPQEDIFLDHAGFSTYESIYRARDVFCVEKLIIVTQKFHLSRALYIAENLGLSAVGVNSDPRKYRFAEYDSLRESFARIKDFFLSNITKPEPTYLGDKIPISGDSELTHDK